MFVVFYIAVLQRFHTKCPSHRERGAQAVYGQDQQRTSSTSTCTIFSMEATGTNSWTPWKLAPPVAEKARRFRGSVPVFTPQRGWKPADTTVFRIAEAPPETDGSGLPFLSRAAFVMGCKGNRLCNKPTAAPSQVKGRVGLPLGEYGSPRPVCGLVVGMTGGGKAGKGRSPRWGERPFVWKNIRV